MSIKSQKRSGFTLAEVIISMAIIGILSVGVYGAYIMLIRQTKDGEVKQGATLAGKKISEEIKDNADNVKKNSDDKIVLTNNIILDDMKEATVMLTRDGNVTTDESASYYKADIKLEDKNTEEGNTIKISKEDYDKRLFVGNTIDSNEEVIKNQSADKVEKTIQINIESELSKTIKYENDVNLPKTIIGDCVVLDFKYVNAESTFKIKVRNDTGNSFKLFILNSRRDERPESIEVINEKGILYEYYRRDYEKSGKLYNIKLDIRKTDSESNDKILFETDFVQNIDVD